MTFTVKRESEELNLKYFHRTFQKEGICIQQIRYLKNSLLEYLDDPTDISDLNEIVDRLNELQSFMEV